MGLIAVPTGILAAAFNYAFQRSRTHHGHDVFSTALAMKLRPLLRKFDFGAHAMVRSRTTLPATNPWAGVVTGDHYFSRSGQRRLPR